MSTEQILLIVLGVLLVIAIVIIAVLATKLKKGKFTTKADDVKVVDGVRYTKSTALTDKNGEYAVTHNEGDIILEQGVTYTAMRGGYLIPGKYTALAALEQDDKFNLRLGGFVREYTHGSNIVLAEGDTVCAVSHTVILR